MGFPVWVETHDDQYAASLVGAPEVRVVERVGVASLAGRYSDDPTLSETCEQAYQMRDAEGSSDSQDA